MIGGFVKGNKMKVDSSNFTLPFHIVCGEEDKVTPSTGAKTFFENSKSTKKSMRIYKGFKHELFKGKGTITIKNDLFDWLEKMLD